MIAALPVTAAGLVRFGRLVAEVSRRSPVRRAGISGTAAARTAEGARDRWLR
jgi:hypothetical protein